MKTSSHDDGDQVDLVAGKVLIIFPEGDFLLVPRTTAKRIPLIGDQVATS